MSLTYLFQVARIANCKVFECMLANKFNLVNKNANAARMCSYLAGRTTKPRSMFLLVVDGIFVADFGEPASQVSGKDQKKVALNLSSPRQGQERQQLTKHSLSPT